MNETKNRPSLNIFVELKRGTVRSRHNYSFGVLTRNGQHTSYKYERFLIIRLGYDSTDTTLTAVIHTVALVADKTRN